MKRFLAVFLCFMLLLGTPIVYGGGSMTPMTIIVVPPDDPPLARDDSYSFSLSSLRAAHGDRISPTLSYENRLWDARISNLRYEYRPQDIGMQSTSAFSIDVKKGTALEISLPMGLLLSTAAETLTVLSFRAEIQPMENGIPIGESYGISGNSDLTIQHIFVQDAKLHFAFLNSSYHVPACIICGFNAGSQEPHVWRTEIIQEAGCEQSEITRFNCDICNYNYSNYSSRPLGHMWSAWVNEPESNFHSRTCSRTGCPIGYEMERCALDAAAAPPTCTEAGYTAYTCTKCSNSFQIPGEAATGHVWENWAHVEGTENNEAMHTQVCANEPTHIETISCTFDKGASTAQTCTEDGYTAYTCTACGYSYQIPGKEADGHDFQPDPSRDTAPDCASSGLEARTCSRCPEQDDQVIKALGHDLLTHGAKTATCTEFGWNAYETCNRDGCAYSTFEEIPALRHNYIRDTARDAAPSCAMEGIEGYTCTHCGEHDDVPLTMLEHTEVIDPAIPATCTHTGLTEGKHCSICSVVLVQQDIIQALGHIEVTDPAVPATCTNTGLTEGKHCSVCSEILVHQDVIKALGHTEVTDPAVPATCTNTGLTEGKRCSICSVVLVQQDVIQALGHTEVSDPAVPATCTNTGLTEGKHCSVCSVFLVQQDIIQALGHIEVTDPAVPAICTNTGLTEGKHCSVCSAVLVQQDVIQALGHTEVIDPAVPAICMNTGLMEGKHCSVCSAVLVKQDVILALGHAWGDWAHAEGTENAQARHSRVCENDASHVETVGCVFEDVIIQPTSTIGGFTEHTCKVCGYIYADELTDPVASETTEPLLTSTKVPAPPLTLTPAPTPSPTAAATATPAPAPSSTPAISIEADMNLVSDTEEGAVPFTLSASQNEGGASELIIRANIQTPASTPVPAEGNSGEESGTGNTPRGNTTMRWSLNQALISEAESSGYIAVRASVKGISVVIPVQELSNFTGEAYVFTIEEVLEDSLSESARTAIEGIPRHSEVFAVRVEGKADDDLILASIALPENANPDQYRIAAINAQNSTLSYPETSLTVVQGVACIEGYVLNGSICFLAMK